MLPTIKTTAGSEQPGLKKLGRYECTEQLGGDGGFETYRARVKGLTGLERSFAVKVLRLKRSESPRAAAEPFIQTAKRSAALANPRIATVVEADAGEGLVFAVTQFMEGLDLGRFLGAARATGLLAGGKDDKARHWYSLVAYIGAEIARGLQAAHSQKPPLVHGALCPGNVFITSRGAVRLLDFGLRASVRRPFEPRPRRLLPYIAPELAAPAAECTTAGDMYTLGVLLCELGSGDSPPQGRRAADLQISLSLLPEGLGLLIGRLVSLSPAARPTADDAVSSLTAVYADATEANLVATLSSLVRRISGDIAAPDEPPEAVVSLAGTPEEADDAPPPPSEVEHDDAYGFEGSALGRAAGPARPVPPARAAAPDDLPGSSEPTTIGEPALIDDLVAKSRSSEPPAPAGSAKIRPAPPAIPGRPASPPVLVSRATPASLAASREPGRGPTLPGFGPTGTASIDAQPAVTSPAPGSSAELAGEWMERPPSGPRPSVAPASAPVASTLPALAPSLPKAAVLSAMESAQDLMLPGVAAFDAPPATWGARALAALGGQAGIDPSPGDSSAGLGLLDQAQPEPAVSTPFGGSPPLGRGGGPSGRLRSPQDLALDDGPTAEPIVEEAPAPDLPGGDPQSGRQEAMVADREAQSAAQPRGDSLLEDELVDSPDGVRLASSWPSASAPPADEGQPAPEDDVYAEQPSPEVAEAVAFTEEDGTESAPEDQAYLDDSRPPAEAPGFFDDNGQPPPEAEIAGMPEAPAARTATWAPRVPEQASGGVVNRPAVQQASVPTWVQSPDPRTDRHPHRRLVWGIVGTVLGASVVIGALAGFLVGSRGKPGSAGTRQSIALAKPEAVQADPLVGGGGNTLPASARAAAGKTPVTDHVGQAPAFARKAPVANPSASENAPAAKQADPTNLPARTPAAVASPPSAQKLALAAPLDKKASNALPATQNAGAPDARGGGSLVGVSIASRPAGASVWVNGTERGRTPLQVRVQPGLAHVALVLAGHASATVDLMAREGSEVSKELQAVEPPLTGEARFRAECSTPGKLPIVIDGKETGVLCPFSRLRVDPGVHKIGLFVPALGKVHEKEVTLHTGVRSIVFAD